MITPTAEQILDELAPAKSKGRYDQVWEAFMAFQRMEDKEKNCPTESNYICYFHLFHKNKGFKASSLWSTHSCLNNHNQRLFELQKWPPIQLILRQYEVGYIRKTAHIFTPEQILLAMQLPKMTPKWVLHKCAIALSYCRRLHCCELWILKVGDLSEEEDGIWVKYSHAKQKAEVKESTLLVPYNRATPAT